MKKKVIIISSIVLGVGLLGGFVVYPAIRKSGIRQRLDTAFNNPSALSAVGGIDKFLVTEAFDPERFQNGTTKTTITRIEAREKASIIYNNYSSWFSSNQMAIVNAFSGLGHIHDVSKIAHEYKALYDDDLLEVIKTALTDKSKYNLLIGKLNNLPKK